MKYQSIQALRALAALMVVVFHSKIAFGGYRESLLWVPGFTDFGDLGVSLFFVISGFIIANVIDRPTFRVSHYFWRRFWRIYPLLWIVMAVGIYHYFLRGWFAADISGLGKGGMLKSLLILPQENYPFWNPAWTLEHEVLFYVIAAIVAPLLGLRWLAALIVALGTFGLFFPIGWDFHLTAYPQIYFAAGITAYLWRDRISLPLAWGIMGAGLGLAYLQAYGVLALPGQVSHYTFSAGATGLIVLGLAYEKRGMKTPAPVVLIGDASYSLYLWHWMLIPVFAMFFERYGGVPEVWRWDFVFASIAVAIISFNAIERTFNAFGEDLYRRIVGFLRPQEIENPAE